jgi:hypothetical protein
MAFQDDADTIHWRLHLTSPPHTVHQMLATDAGRAGFWAESAVEYFGGSTAAFELADDGMGGTDLILTDAGVPIEDRGEVIAGWVRATPITGATRRGSHV